MSGYVRQSLADIVPGVIVQAGPLNKEFNALSGAFSGSTGHTHDGTTGNGPRLSLTQSVTGILPVANGGTGSSDLSEIQTNLGLEIGTNVLAYYEHLDNLGKKAGSGIAVRSTGSAWEFRELQGVLKEIKVSDGTGVAGNPRIGFADELDFGARKIAGGDFTSIKAIGTFDGDGSKLKNIPFTGITGLNTELDKKFDKAGGTITGPTTFADTVTIGTGKQVIQPTLPTQPNNLVNKQYSDAQSVEDRKRENHTGESPMSSITGLASEFLKYLKLAGGVMTGLLDMGAQRITNLAQGTQPTDAVRMDQLEFSSPPGLISPYGGLTAPSGWLICNGQAVSRTNYPKLFAVIGTRFGQGDGVSTFNVPNFIRRIPIGADLSSINVGTLGGSETYTLTTAMLPAHSHGVDITVGGGRHSHPFTIFGHQFSDQGGSRPTLGGADLNLSWTSNTAETEHFHRVLGDTKMQGSGAGYPVLQPYVGVNYIIRT